MALVPQYQCVPGALTQDFLGTIMDKVIAVADMRTAIVFIYDNWTELQAIAASADELIPLMQEAVAAAQNIDEVQAAVTALHTEVLEARDVALNAASHANQDSVAAQASASTARMYGLGAQAAKEQSEAILEMMTRMTADLGLNNVNLEFGERFFGSATLMYGGRF